MCVCVRNCICVYVAACLGELVCTMKTPERNDLKRGTVVVLDTLLQPTDFGFKGARVRVQEWM